MSANILEEKNMKNTRKILTLLLSLALLVACFSVMVFAEETAPEEELGLASYTEALAKASKVLEFYEAGAYFELKVDNEGNLIVNESEEGKLLKGGAYTGVVTDGALNMTSLNPTKVNLTQTTPDSFGLNVRAKITDGSSISLYIASAETGDYLSLFTVSVGSIAHKFNPSTFKYETEEIALGADEFFDLSIYVEKGKSVDTVYYSIKTDGGAEKSGSYSYENDSTDFLSGKFAYDHAYLSTTSATFNYIEMYPGTYQRFVDNTKNVDVIADQLTAVYADYIAHKDVADVENGAFDLAAIIAKVAVLYGYPVNDIANSDVKAAVNGAFEDCVAVASKVYENAIVLAKAEIENEDNAKKSYNDRLDVAVSVLDFVPFMNRLEASELATVSAVDFEAVNAAFAVAEAEKAALDKIEADSIFVIEALSSIGNIYLATYEDLKVAYEAVSGVEISDTYYSDLYSADVVNEAVQKRKVVVANYPELKTKAEVFVSNVIIAANVDYIFSARYAAYTEAKQNIFTDATYNKYLTGTTVAELNAMFNAVDVEMKAVSEVAEQFLSKIREAELTPSYTVKIQALDGAKPYLNTVEVGYPEVEDAIASYYAMREDIASRQEAAKRYIQAVINVQVASTVKEKLVAIEIAEGFAVLGNEASVEIEGMKMSVTEANIILSEEKSAIALKSTRINNYVAAVDAIASKQTLVERRQAINVALALKKNVVDDAAEEDVINASTNLDAAISAYNNEVKQANNAAAENEKTALTIIAKTVPTKRMAEVVAIVKKKSYE